MTKALGRYCGLRTNFVFRYQKYTFRTDYNNAIKRRRTEGLMEALCLWSNMLNTQRHFHLVNTRTHINPLNYSYILCKISLLTLLHLEYNVHTITIQYGFMYYGVNIPYSSLTIPFIFILWVLKFNNNFAVLIYYKYV